MEKSVKLASIKLSPHNPKSRMRRPAYIGLERSMERFGQLSAVLLSKKNNHLIDGHRRYHAATSLGWKEVNATYYQGDNPDQAYAEINATAKKITGAENLQIWLVNENAVTEISAKQFENYQAEYTMPILRLLAKNQMGTRPLRTANSIAKYCGAEDDTEFKRLAARWLIKHRIGRLTEGYMDMQASPSGLFKAVKNDKPIKATYLSK